MDTTSEKPHPDGPSSAEATPTAMTTEIGEKLDEHYLELFGGPPERLAHDSHLEELTVKNFQIARDLIRACKSVGVWRLKQGELPKDAGSYLADLACELAHAVQDLVHLGDVMLARRLPATVAILNDASKVYGSRITYHPEKRLSIEQILKKHSARSLLAMLSALIPDWHRVGLYIFHPPLRQLPEQNQNEILLRKRRAVESWSEQQLKKLILSKVRFTGWKGDEWIEDLRKHALAEIIENIFAMREDENKNINLFVANLWRGWLWQGPGPTFQKCDWHGKTDLPPRNNVREWMKMVIPYFRRITNDDPMKLCVFEQMIAVRKAVYVGDNDPNVRLSDDKRDYVWNQVRTRLAQAWTTMSRPSRKRNSQKPA